MPKPERSPAPPPLPARKHTPASTPAREMTPPPLPGRAAPAAAPPAAAKNDLAMGKNELEHSLDDAFKQMVAPPPSRGTAPRPAATAADMAALHATYLDLAVEYCTPVRNVMLEVRWGEPPMLWLEQVATALAALRGMSEKVELATLTTALDGFNSAVAAALDSGETVVRAQRREKLLAAYAPLSAALPRAFDLEGERDRREPIILRSLLLLVPELSPLAVEKFFSAGLVRLEAISKAKPEDIAAVTGLDQALAGRVLELVKAEGALAAADAGKERQHLGTLTARLAEEHRALEKASAGWSAESQSEKRGWRRKREQSWLRIKISMAKLGEAERLERLEKLPFAGKLEALEGFLRTDRRPPGARAA
jgi:hypothetical protein